MADSPMQTDAPPLERLDEIFIELLRLRRAAARTLPIQFIQRWALKRQIKTLLHEQKTHRGETQ